MIRFLFGVAVGAMAMYWFQTGQIPWRTEITAWFSRTASSYTAERHRTEADRLIRDPEPPKKQR